MNFDLIKNTLLLLLGLYVFSALCSFLQSYIMNTVSCKISYNLRKDIIKKMHKLPLSYFEKQTHGELLSRITNDVDTLSSNLSQTLSQAVSSVATLIGTLVMMISISTSMTIASILILPLSIVLMGLIMGKSQKYFTRQQENLGDINGIVEETYGGHDVVKVFKVVTDKDEDKKKVKGEK